MPNVPRRPLQGQRPSRNVRWRWLAWAADEPGREAAAARKIRIRDRDMSDVARDALATLAAAGLPDLGLSSSRLPTGRHLHPRPSAPPPRTMTSYPSDPSVVVGFRADPARPVPDKNTGTSEERP
jgi:hypothetical protein